MRNLFSNPGDTPNFFSLGFASFFGSGIDSSNVKSLIRPPPMAPPSVPNRSGNLFGDLLEVLQGGPVEVRSDEHRKLLVRECRYYRFRNLEQRLIECSIVPNRGRQTTEIIINVEDVKVDELSIQAIPTIPTIFGSTFYKRPFVDQDAPARELVIQIKHDEQAALLRVVSPSGVFDWEAVFFDTAKTKISKILNHLANVAGVSVSKSLRGYVINMDEAYIELNGMSMNIIAEASDIVQSGDEDSAATAVSGGSFTDGDGATESGSAGAGSVAAGSRKRQRTSSTGIYETQKPGQTLQMVCTKSQWRIIQNRDNNIQLQLLTATCISGQRYKNKMRKFI